MGYRVSLRDLLKLQNINNFGVRWMSNTIGCVQKIQYQMNEDKQIGLTKKDQKALLNKPPDPKSSDMLTLKVAIIGAPNAGKSTLANKLIGWKFASVSQKVHTTRHKVIGILTEENKQLIFLDTPGIISPEKIKRHNLETSLLIDPHSALYIADLIVVVVDVSHIWHRTKIDPEILKLLYLHQNKQSILVLNKVDLMKNRKDLLNITRRLSQGIVGGVKNWETMKTQNKADLDSLFKAMKQKTTLPVTNNQIGNVERNENKFVNNENDEDFVVQQIHTDDLNTTINVCQSSQVLSDADEINSSDDGIEFEEEVDTRLCPNIQHNNLRDPVVWNMYYKNLKKIGRELFNKHGWPHFSRVFMLSALEGDGIFELRNYLLDQTHSSPWQFNSAVVTNQDPIELAKLCVWEKLLDHLHQDIPYKIKVHLSLWEVTEDNFLRASFDLICCRKRHVTSILGRNGETIQRIASEAKQEIMNAFRREMSLQLVVRGSSPSAKTQRK